MPHDAATVEAIPTRACSSSFACRWHQRWSDVLFLHWRVDHAALRPFVPAPLSIDTFEGEAWVSIVLFHMSIRARGLPHVPGFSFLPELNLRTYVRRNDAPGIYFLSVHTNHRLLGWLARIFSPMRYQQANMRYRRAGEHFKFDSTSRAAPTQSLGVSFEPNGTVRTGECGGLNEWLAERYRLYIEDGRGGICHGEVEHPPWPLTEADYQIHKNTMGAPFGLPLNAAPHAAHYSPGVDVRFGRFSGGI